MDRNHYKKKLFELYRKYLQATTPYEKSVYEKNIIQMLDLGRSFPQGKKHEVLEMILRLYRQYIQADNPFDRATSEERLNKALEKLRDGKKEHDVQKNTE